MRRRPLFQKTAAAIGRCLYEEHCTHLGLSPDQELEAVAFVLRRYHGMPDFLRLPFGLMTLLFSFSARLRHGKAFHYLPREKRIRHVAAWRTSSFGYCRDFIHFYEGLVVFFGYSAWEEALTES